MSATPETIGALATIDHTDVEAVILLLRDAVNAHPELDDLVGDDAITQAEAELIRNTRRGEAARLLLNRGIRVRFRETPQAPIVPVAPQASPADATRRATGGDA